jgi:hypothetical protein
MLLGVSALAGSSGLIAQVKTNVSYEDIEPLIGELRAHLPDELKGEPGNVQRNWRSWVAARDAHTRARVARGDEDSVLNLLLLGTSFTKEPRIVTPMMATSGLGRVDHVVRKRAADLVAAAQSTDGNERLTLVREVLRRRGLDLSSTAGRQQAERYLLDEVQRMVREIEQHLRSQQMARARADLAGAYAERMAFFSARGLSSDTSLLPSYGIEQAMAAMKSAGFLGAGAVWHAAVVGPGLDFVDKNDGIDVYPQQSPQPFLLIDSLLRLGLSAPGRLQLATLDVSPFVNHHLHAAREHARAGYALTLPIDTARAWTNGYAAYWRQSGDRVADDVETTTLRASGATFALRRIRVRPGVVEAITPFDLNVVLQRLSGGPRFDLIVVSNVLIYYGVFEQALALANIAAMLKPGGWLISNDALPMLRATPLKEAGSVSVVYADGLGYTERLSWYRRQ